MEIPKRTHTHRNSPTGSGVTMRRGFRPWTKEELKFAIDLKQEKWTHAQIGQELGRSASAVAVQICMYKNKRDPRYRPQRNESQRYEHVTSLRISDEQITDRESREQASYQRDTTALLMGDPAPGYSALDTRSSR